MLIDTLFTKTSFSQFSKETTWFFHNFQKKRRNFFTIGLVPDPLTILGKNAGKEWVHAVFCFWVGNKEFVVSCSCKMTGQHWPFCRLKKSSCSWHLRINSQVWRVDYLHHWPGLASAFLLVLNGYPVPKVWH